VITQFIPGPASNSVYQLLQNACLKHLGSLLMEIEKRKAFFSASNDDSCLAILSDPANKTKICFLDLGFIWVMRIFALHCFHLRHNLSFKLFLLLSSVRIGAIFSTGGL
jgi:hypothetical protein